MQQMWFFMYPLWNGIANGSRKLPRQPGTARNHQMCWQAWNYERVQLESTQLSAVNSVTATSFMPVLCPVSSIFKEFGDVDHNSSSPLISSFWTSAVMFAIITLLLIAVLHYADAQSLTEDCWCKLQVRQGRILINYGTVANYKILDSQKQFKCKAACAKRCSADIRNAKFLCNTLGGDFDNSAKSIGCFSVLGSSNTVDTVWDYDDRATLNGCKKACTCPQNQWNWYDVNRVSCVTGAGCSKLMGIPNGDKGNGFFAWDNALYQDVPGAVCTVAVIWNSIALWTQALKHSITLTSLCAGWQQLQPSIVKAGEYMASTKCIPCGWRVFVHSVCLCLFFLPLLLCFSCSLLFLLLNNLPES